MPTALRITSRLHVTPLLDIQHPPFEKLYRDGVYWSLFKDRCTSPLSDRYLLENVKASLRATDVDGQYAYCLPTIGFHFGRLHGAILSSQTGQPRPDVTTIACFVNKDAAHGYAVGRRWYFVTPQDSTLWEELDHQFWAKASRRATNTEPLDPVPVGKYIV